MLRSIAIAFVLALLGAGTVHAQGAPAPPPPPFANAAVANAPVTSSRYHFTGPQLFAVFGVCEVASLGSAAIVKQRKLSVGETVSATAKCGVVTGAAVAAPVAGYVIGGLMLADEIAQTRIFDALLSPITLPITNLFTPEATSQTRPRSRTRRGT